MPGHKTHKAFAALSFVAALGTYHAYTGGGLAQLCTPLTLLLVGFATLGGLFPDIDIKSKGQELWYRILLVLSIYAWLCAEWELFPGLLIAAIIPPLLPHRGLTHDSLALTLLTGLLLLHIYTRYPDHFSLALALVGSFLWGALSHIAIDTLPGMLRWRFFRRKRR